MRGFFSVVGFFFGAFSAINAQKVEEKNFYTSPITLNQTSIIQIKAPYAEIQLQSTQNENPFTIKGNLDKKKFDAVFKQSSTEKYKKHELIVKNISDSKMDSSPLQLFSPNEDGLVSSWLVFVSKIYHQILEFNVGGGKLDLNLSNLKAKSVHITSIKADNNIYYQLGQPNQVMMDTMIIKNELGNVNIKNFTLSNCKHFIAELGFGKINFHMGGLPKESCKYRIKIGTGELHLKLPYKDMSLKLIINGSSLSKHELPKDMKHINKRTYVSPSYDENDSRKMVIEVDVSLGKVVLL